MRRTVLWILAAFMGIHASGGDTLVYNSELTGFKDGDVLYADKQLKVPFDSVAKIINGKLGNYNIASDAKIATSKLDTTGTVKAAVFKGDTVRVKQLIADSIALANGVKTVRIAASGAVTADSFYTGKGVTAARLTSTGITRADSVIVTTGIATARVAASGISTADSFYTAKAVKAARVHATGTADVDSLYSAKGISATGVSTTTISASGTVTADSIKSTKGINTTAVTASTLTSGNIATASTNGLIVNSNITEGTRSHGLGIPSVDPGTGQYQCRIGQSMMMIGSSTTPNSTYGTNVFYDGATAKMYAIRAKRAGELNYNTNTGAYEIYSSSAAETAGDTVKNLTTVANFAPAHYQFGDAGSILTYKKYTKTLEIANTYDTSIGCSALLFTNQTNTRQAGLYHYSNTVASALDGGGPSNIIMYNAKGSIGLTAALDGKSIRFATGSTPACMANVSSTGLRVGDSTAATQMLDVVGNATAKQYGQTVQTSATTAGAVSWDLSAGNMLQMTTKMTDTLVITMTNPIVGSESTLLFQEGSTPKKIRLTKTGATFNYISSSTSSASPLILATTDLGGASVYCIIKLLWVTTSLAYVWVEHD